MTTRAQCTSTPHRDPSDHRGHLLRVVFRVAVLLAACGDSKPPWRLPDGGGAVGDGASAPSDAERADAGGGGTDCTGPACGPGVKDFFDNGKVATIRITFDPADTAPAQPAEWLDLLWERWNHCPPFEPEDFVRVGFEYESPDGRGNVTMTDVGMRLRGGKRRDVNQLQGFKLEFQKLLGPATGAARRRFADVNRLNTLSIEADPTHMVQCAAYKMMRDFGLPSPYCNHLKVYVNGAYHGLMENVEEPEIGRFQAHHFGSTAGEVYEGSPSQRECTGPDSFADGRAKLLYSGDRFDDYPGQYKITRGTPADAEAHLIPMLRCGDVTQTPDDDEFKTCISEWLDVDEWLKQIAAESLMPTVESFMVQRNYLLYFVPDARAPHGGRFQLSSWDLDVAFHKASCYPSDCDPFTASAGYLGPRGRRTQLATRLTAVFRAGYCAAMRDFLSTVYRPERVTEMASVIDAAMLDQPTTPYEVWRSMVETMRDFIAMHGPAALAQVNDLCAAVD